jgi:hypothetical protein
MAKAKGSRGHRSKAEDVLSRKATQHHDFVGQAEPDREQSRAVEQQRIRRDQERLDEEVVRDMTQELEQMAGVAEPPPPAAAQGEQASAATGQEAPRFEIPGSLREAVEMIRQHGPAALEALRAKAEQRLEQMPAPVKTAVRLTERAMGIAFWPVRAGAQLFGRMLETPAALIRIFIARSPA